ncbi:MAG: epoxyqueuosine reductase QueH [Alphaproteobacteria bacterium]|nr:epoxyqueuosine reductase QueH [Alphaproteobacteria bacterium]
MFPDGMGPGTKVLLHICCAPCSCAILEGMKASGLDVTAYFYNPNIHPHEEYEKRKAEVIAFAGRLGVPFIDADYDVENWMERVKGLEAEPERGKRCSVCFEMRLARTALYAQENEFPFIAPGLSISRHKNQAQVHEAGHAAAARFEEVTFWDYNWRAKGGAERGAALAKQEGFYRQNYCGCRFSTRGN